MEEQEQQPQPTLSLTERDRELIAEQLRIQHAESDIERQNFTAAYVIAKKFAYETDLAEMDSDTVEDMVMKLGMQVYPRKNQYGLRSFQPQNPSGEPIGVPPGAPLERALGNWRDQYAEAATDPDELYFDFEYIHPFDDGNGRVGQLMWAIDNKRRYGQWPTALPPDYAELKARYTGQPPQSTE